jgi:hypothetical protein
MRRGVGERRRCGRKKVGSSKVSQGIIEEAVNKRLAFCGSGGGEANVGMAFGKLGVEGF